MRKCTNRNTEAENESRAKGEEILKKDRRGESRVGHDRDIKLKGYRQSRKGLQWPRVAAPRGPRQC